MSQQRQVFRFAVIGGAGFLVDTGVLYLLHEIGLSLYIARFFSFAAAATFTWIGNRHYTFESGPQSRWSIPGEWLRYVVAMGAGGLLNYAVFAALVALHQGFRQQPWMAVAAGTAAGMLLNFILARRILAHPPG
jgi:putative flippase GtrA